MPCKKNHYKIPYLILALALLAGVLCSCSSGSGGALLSGYTLSTGKSDCTLFCCGGKTVVIDTADEDDFSAICDKLSAAGANSIDVLILTHFDADHIGSAAALIEKYSVGTIYAPDYTDDSDEYNALVSAAAERGVEITKLTDDTAFTAGECTFSIDAPNETSYDNVNNYSLITTVSCGNVNLLFLGDAMKERVAEWNSANSLSSLALVKIAHHGEYNKSTKELIENTKPANAIICAAGDSTIDDELISLLSSQGCTVYKTYSGEVDFSTDGKTFSISQ